MRNLTFKAAMLKGSQPTVNRQSTDGQSQRHCKQTPLSKRWKVLMTLVFLFTLAIGQMWGTDYVITLDEITPSSNWYTVTGVGRVTNKTGNAFSDADYAKNDACSHNGYKTGSSNFTVQTYKAVSAIKVWAAGTSNRDINYVTVQNAATTATSSNTVSYTAPKNGSYHFNKNKCDQEVTITFASTVAANQYINVCLSGNADIIAVTLVEASVTKHSVTYALGDGTGTTPTQADVAEGAKFTLHNGTTSITAPSGKQFAGWNDGTTTYAGGAEYTMGTDDVELTAVWETAKTNPTATFSNGAYVVGASALDLSGLWSSNSDGAVTYALKEASDDASVTAGAFSATKAGSYVVTASQAATSTYNAIEKEATITVTWPATGAATIIYNVAVGTSESSFTTANMDDNSASISNLVGFAANNITPSGSGKAKSSPKLETPQNKVQNKYVSVTFDVAEGKEFVLDSVVTQIVAVTSAKTIEVVVVAGETKDSLNYSQGTNSDPGNSHQFNFSANAKAYTGTVTVKIYAYGATDSYRIGKPLKVCGKVQNAKVVKTTDYALTDVKVNGTSISAANLATLKTASAYKVDLADQFAAAPTIKFNKETTITYTDDSQKVTDEEISVDATTVDGKWQAQAEIGGITYTVTAVKVTSFTVNYFDEDGTTDLGSEIVAVGSHPTASEITATKDYYTFASWKQSDAAVALSDVSAAAGETVTLVASYTPAYATSINIEQWVLDNGAGKGATTKTSALLAEMGTKNYLSNIAWENKNNELDTLDDSKTDGKRNYAYLGLKVKKDASNVRLLLQDGKSLKVKFGNVAATPNIKIGDAAATAMTITDGVYSLDAASGDREITISTTSAGAVVFKQIMIDEEIQNVILPAIVTLDANGGTYTDESVKYTGTPLVIGDATPADAEHIFEGWHVGTVEGAKVDASAYVPTANVTLVAHYVAKPSPFSLTALTYQVGTAGAVNVGYVEGTYEYTVKLPYAHSYDAITVAATLKESTSNIKDDAVLTVSAVPGAATFTVTDGVDEQLYTVNFVKDVKDGVEIIGVVTTGGTNKTVSGLYKGAASVSLANDKKIGNENYIYVTLAEGYTFEETDVLVVDVKAKSDLPNDPALEITTGDGNIDGSVWKSIANADYELNLVTIPLTGIAANQTSIGLKRSDHQNTWVNGLKVYRPMNPVLTAIQFNETDVEVTSTAVAATLPNGTNLSTMTVTPTIAWNGAGTAAPTAAWAWGPNTYRVTDKDGDYTDYTITLTEAIPAVDPTLTYNEGAYMVGASALDLSTLIDEANSDGEITYTVKTDGGTSATITDGKFTATAAGTATITATQAATVAYNAKTVDFNVVVTVATEIDGIKLVEAGALTGKFVTASTLSDGAYTIEGINYAKYIKFNSTFSGSYNSGARNNYLIYDLKKENTTFHVYAHNNTSTAYKIVAYAYDDVNAKVAEVEVAANENAIKSFSLNDITKNTRVFIGVENNNIYFCQVVAVESGADLMKAGEPGYSIDFGAKSRFTAASGTAIDLDGMEFVTSSGYTPNSSTEVGLGSIGTNYVKFKLDAPTTVEVKTNSTNQYYIGPTYDAEAATSKTYGYKPTSNGETHSFDLTAGTWYLNPNTSNIKLTKLAFSLPKCEKPTITAQPATKQTFGPGNLTATVVADDPSDGGTLKYQWYDAATDEEVENATEATLTTTTEGTYYVIVTNTLANHSDNSVKSDEATLGYRVTNDATLSVLKYGETAIALEDDKYDYRVDLAMGTIDVPELTATATMAPYPTVVVTNATEFVEYEATSTVVVTAEDGVTTKTYTVKFYVDHIYTALVPVTGSTTWNWKNAATDDATINDVPNKGAIIANYLDGMNFEKIEGKENEKAFRDQNDGVYQGTHLHFTTTVPGKVKFYFRAPSSGEECVITVINNGKEIRVDSTGNSLKWSREVVVYGDVVIEMENKKEGKTDTRVQEIVFTEATPNYSRDVTNNIGTLCVDHNVLAGGAMGATFYQIAGRNATYPDKIDFDEVAPNEELKAGEPYIFQSTTGRIDLFYAEGDAVTDSVVLHGMHGVLVGGNLEITEANMMDVYYISENKLRDCSNLVSSGLTLVANRAYIVMSEVDAAPSQPAPGRRRVTMGVQGSQIATGIENLNASDKPMKLMINGQIFILRGEKMYDATGRLVK